MDSLARSLGNSAEQYALRAVRAHIDDDLDDFYLCAGIGLEHATKAHLAGKNPTFLADGANPAKRWESMRLLHRFAADIQDLPVDRVVTIGGAEAVGRAADVSAEFAPYRSSALELVRFRNGEAHLGMHGGGDPTKALADFARAISLLRIEPEEFWGEHAELVRATIDETVSDTERRVAHAIAGARQSFRSTYDNLDEPERQFLIQRREAETDDNVDTHTFECPSCGHLAELTGDVKEEYDVDYDHRERVAVSAHLYLDFYPQSLDCRVCGLVLRDRDELDAAGIPEMFTHEEFDIVEYEADSGDW